MKVESVHVGGGDRRSRLGREMDIARGWPTGMWFDIFFLFILY